VSRRTGTSYSGVFKKGKNRGAVQSTVVKDKNGGVPYGLKEKGDEIRKPQEIDKEENRQPRGLKKANKKLFRSVGKRGG